MAEQRQTSGPAAPDSPVRGASPVGSGAASGTVEPVPVTPPSAAVFLVLRRMRVPLMVLIVMFAVCVLGLTLVPGEDPEGRVHHLSFFDAFYVMSYTATTIGFGELPYPFTDAQRLWLTICIYLTVVSWAYAIGALLTLLQDRAFQAALALQHFQRKVNRLREPFLLVAGFGQTGQVLARSLDGIGHRLVVLDTSAERIDTLDQAAFRADIPGLVADARGPHHLRSAGLHSACCEGVLALTDDDEANLAVTMSAALLRPDLPVVARTVSSTVAHRMQAFGTPTVINPFDRFGEHLLLALSAPSSFQLMTWLEAGPGAELPDVGRRPPAGRWVLCGYGRFGRALAHDLGTAGVELTVVEVDEQAQARAEQDGVHLVAGDGSEPSVLAQAHLENAVGVVAGTRDDTTNLSLIAAARRLNPKLFVIGRQNSPEDAPLFEAMQLDSLLVPTELVAHEAYARLSTPLLWRFLQEMPAQGDAWAAELVEELVDRCGERLPALWKVRLTAQDAPALRPWLADGQVRLGELLRHPEVREQDLEALVLLVQRHGQAFLRPGPDFVLASGDELLLAGQPDARWALTTTLLVDATVDYVLTGERRPVGWLWQRLSRRPALDRSAPRPVGPAGAPAPDAAPVPPPTGPPTGR